MIALDPAWPREVFGQRPHIYGMGICPVKAGEVQTRRSRNASLMLFPYRSRLYVNSQVLTIEAGTLVLAPPESRKRHEPEEDSSHIWVDFELPDLRPGAEATRFRLDGEFVELDAALRNLLVIRLEDPLRAEVRFWDLLLGLGTTDRIGGRHRSRIVDETRARIETALHEKLGVEDLAAAAGVSRSYLTRLFRQVVGKSCASYLLERRMERARWLLCSTDRSVKSIAREAGFPDLQAFNKAVRRAYGRSPRSLRDAETAATSATGVLSADRA